MKTSNLILSIFAVFAFVAVSAAQDLDLKKLPKYVVVATTNGGIVSDIDVDIRIKKSKYREELKRLEKLLESDSVKTYTDLLNTMDELGFEFLDSFENKVKGDFLPGDSKIRQNLVFRKKGSD